MNVVELERRLASLEERAEVLAAERLTQDARDDQGGGATDQPFCVVREVQTPTEPWVWVTTGRMLNESPWYVLAQDVAVPVRTEPGLVGRHYQYFVWEGDGTGFPDHPIDPGMITLPMSMTDGTQIVRYAPRLWMPSPILPTVKHTDCYLVSGGGADVEIIYA